MSILKMVNYTDSNRRRLVELLAYVNAPSKTLNGQLTGGVGCYPTRAAEEMILVKRAYRKTGGRQLIAYVVSITPDLASVDNDTYMRIADEIARLHGDYQCAYAIHLDAGVRHAHFVMNSVSYRTGLKFSQSQADLNRFKQRVSDILVRHMFEPIVSKCGAFLEIGPDSDDGSFGFLEIDQQQAETKDFFHKPMTPSPRDFFSPARSESSYGHYRNPDYPNPRDPFAGCCYERRRQEMDEYNETYEAAAVPADVSPADICPVSAESAEIGSVLPTVSVNVHNELNVAVDAADALSPDFCRDFEQDELNRIGTFALAFQQEAQQQGISVNLSVEIFNVYNITVGGSAGEPIPAEYEEDEEKS